MIESAGVHGGMTGDYGRSLLHDPLDGGQAAVGGPAVHGPEDPARRSICFFRHHLCHEAIDGCDPGGVLTAAEDLASPAGSRAPTRIGCTIRSRRSEICIRIASGYR